MSPTATSPALTEIDGLESTDAVPGLLWRTAPPDDLQGAVLAAYIFSDATTTGDDKPALKPIDVVFEEGPYGTALAYVFSEEYKARGGTPDLLGFPEGDTENREDQLSRAAISWRRRSPHSPVPPAIPAIPAMPAVRALAVGLRSVRVRARLRRGS